MNNGNRSKHVKLGQRTRTMARIDAMEDRDIDSIKVYEPKKHSGISIDAMFNEEAPEQKKQGIDIDTEKLIKVSCVVAVLIIAVILGLALFM